MSSKHLTLSLILFWSLHTAPEKAAAQQPVNFQVFYDQLSPYGTWVNDPEYGYVWLPGVESGFAPYATNGYWLSTDAGWTWVSDYPWGWAPFHYGRWYNDARYGPVWMPDYAWSPAWVSWRSSKSYYGWAPLPPAHGHGHHLNNGQWIFVKNQDFGKRDIQNYYVHNSRNGSVMPYSTPLTNNRPGRYGATRYNAGPNQADVARRAGRTIAPMTITDRNEPGQELTASQLQLYRPQLQQAGFSGSRPAPASVSKWQDVKQRNATNRSTTSSGKWSTQSADPSKDKWSGQAAQRSAPARSSSKKWDNQPATQRAAAPARTSTKKWEGKPSTQRAAPAQPAGKWHAQPAPTRAKAALRPAGKPVQKKAGKN